MAIKPPSERDATYIAHRRESDGAIQCLESHLSAVGKLASRYAAKIKIKQPDSADAIDLAAVGDVLGLLHDFGKYSKSFQNYLKSAVGLIDWDEDDFVNAVHARGRIDHSTAGAQFIWKSFASSGPHGVLAAQVMALCIASHHSGLIDCMTPDGEDNFSRRIKKAEISAHLEEAIRNADASLIHRVATTIDTGRIPEIFQKVIASLMAVESRAGGSNLILKFKTGLLVRFLFSALIDADRVDSADFENPRAGQLRHDGNYPSWAKLIGRVEKHLGQLNSSESIDALRREISDYCLMAAERPRGIFTLTVPTGGGKTLASLRFALHHAKKHKLDRIIYVIPFTSIIDQNADVVRGILEPTTEGVERGSIVLEHHSNLTPEEQTWRSKILSENWDAPVIFTTSVQLLETLFGGGTRGARRMHQLANAVIIFDEAQTVPLRCIHMFNNAINFLVEQCGSSVVLCTATQPLLNAVDSKLGAARFQTCDEIIPNVPKLFSALKRTVVVSGYKPGGWLDEEVATLAAEEIAETGSCLVIVNTRKAAQSLYQVCVAAAGVTTYHPSTSMCPQHRREVLAAIRNNLQNRIPTLCISTQLIEAGVDVDFGAVIRHVAGLDSIAQAAGRCNRNGRRRIGRVHVINPIDDRIERLIDIAAGRDVTLRIFNEYGQDPAGFDDDLLGPKAMARYFDYYFFQRSVEMDYPVAASTTGRDDTLLSLLSTNDMAVDTYHQREQSGPLLYLRQSFMTAAQAFKALDAATQGVIVPYIGLDNNQEGPELIAQLCAAFQPETQFALLRRAQQFSVNVFPHVFDALKRADAIGEIGEGIGIYHLRPDYYNQFFGLSDIPTTTMETHCV
jgi:CRISPR-associated endonuclease/helicase Cas3